MAYVPLSNIQRGFARIMAGRGQAMTLKRSGEADLAVKGKRLLLRVLEDAVGNASQDAFRLKIGTAELTASTWASPVPKPGDTIVIDGRTCSVLGVWPLEDAGATIAYELEVAG